MSCCHLISSHFAETAATPVGQTVLGLMVGTAVTVLILVCSIAGMILKKLSSSGRGGLSDTIQGNQGEEYMQMERKTLVQETAVKIEGDIERTEVSYQVTAPDNVNSDSYLGAYNGRDTFKGGGMTDAGKLGHSGPSYGISHVTDHGRIHGDDQGIHHGIRNTVIHDTEERDLQCSSEHMASHGMDPGSIIGDQDFEDGWGGYEHQDTRILLPARKSYNPHQRTNVTLNPIFE